MDHENPDGSRHTRNTETHLEQMPRLAHIFEAAAVILKSKNPRVHYERFFTDKRTNTEIRRTIPKITDSDRDRLLTYAQEFVPQALANLKDSTQKVSYEFFLDRVGEICSVYRLIQQTHYENVGAGAYDDLARHLKTWGGVDTSFASEAVLSRISKEVIPPQTNLKALAELAQGNFQGFLDEVFSIERERIDQEHIFEIRSGESGPHAGERRAKQLIGTSQAYLLASDFLRHIVSPGKG